MMNFANPHLIRQKYTIVPGLYNKQAFVGFYLIVFVFLAGFLAAVSKGYADPSHGIAMYGKPALPADYTHLPYSNPDATQGGKVVYGVVGTYDSLNPFILKSMRTTARGIWDPQFGNLVYQSLLFRSRDEPFTLYGLLAEKVEMPEDRSWIEFSLNPVAKWSDGTPVTPEDVIFTYKILTEKGRPPYSSRTKRIEKIEKTGPMKVKFTFNEKSDREFPLLVGITPVLPKHAIDPEEFGKSSLKLPVGSGPYLVDKVEPGKRITYRKNPEYWAKDLPIARGFDNFETIKIEYFRQVSTQFEAFKKGLVDIYTEGDPAHWRRAYNFKAVEDGRISKDSFNSDKPANMLGFVFNTRKQKFKSRDVRKALSSLFDFEWTNKNLFFDSYQRTASFWHGSALSSVGKSANTTELALHKKVGATLDPEVVDGTYLPSQTNGSGRDRKVLRKAYNGLLKAGFQPADGQLMGPNGQPLMIEILTKDQNQEQLALAFRRTLVRIGIGVTIRSVDDTQYQKRLQTFDFDMIIGTYSASLSPGAEQNWRWASVSKDLEGSFNYAGVAEPSIDNAISEMINARETEDYNAAVRTLDRLLISGYYVVPLFHLPEQRIARWSYLGVPDKTPLYGSQFPVWWDKRATQ